MIREPTGDGTAYRRLLDLLAGWADYLAHCAEGYPAEREMYEREAEAVLALYQDMGTRSGPYSELDRQAFSFLQTKVLDLVTLGAGPNESVAEDK